MSDLKSRVAEFYSIGHSNRTLEQFIELLSEFEIEILADVRAFPGSRRLPQFNKDQLQSELAEHRIDYAHFPGLGGRRGAGKRDSPNGGLRNAGFRNYADYMATGEFHDAVDQMLDAAGERRLAMMCAEAVYWRCHRRLISDHLYATHGLVVGHILGPGQVRDHQLTDTAHPADTGLTYPPPLAGEGE